MKILFFSLFFISSLFAAEKKSSSTKEFKVYTSAKNYTSFQKIVYHHEYILIPSGCILYLPKQHESKVTPESGDAKQISFFSFINKHRSFIYTIPLTKNQAFGTKTTPPFVMPYEQFEGLKKLGRIIICTYNNKPVKISIEKKPQKK